MSMSAPIHAPPAGALEMLPGPRGKSNLNRSSRVLYSGDTAWIELTKGQWAVVDLASLLIVCPHHWSANWTRDRFYAVTVIDGLKIGMHCLLMHGALADHKDGDGLNNRMSNLRACTHAQNARNSRTPRSNSSGFKGVSFKAKSNRYVARIVVNGKEKYQGRWIWHALDVLKVEYMALLLNWSWPGAGSLGKLWDAHPPATVYLMRWKIDFTGEGAPPMLNGWFIWDRRHKGETRLRMMDRIDVRQPSLIEAMA